MLLVELSELDDPMASLFAFVRLWRDHQDWEELEWVWQWEARLNEREIGIAIGMGMGIVLVEGVEVGVQIDDARLHLRYPIFGLSYLKA